MNSTLRKHNCPLNPSLEQSIESFDSYIENIIIRNLLLFVVYSIIWFIICWNEETKDEPNVSSSHQSHTYNTLFKFTFISFDLIN